MDWKPSRREPAKFPLEPTGENPTVSSPLRQPTVNRVTNRLVQLGTRPLVQRVPGQVPGSRVVPREFSALVPMRDEGFLISGAVSGDRPGMSGDGR
jgi:hypothetical protein